MSDVQALYGRLLEYGNIVVIRTDQYFHVTSVFGNPERILGVSVKDLLNDRTVWRRLFSPRELRRLAVVLRSMRNRPRELREEIRIVHQRSGRERWLLLRGVPIFGNDHSFQGWEGFGLDITEKFNTQEQLFSQSKRIEALYEVSRALRVSMDPALVMLRGLRALIRATGSDSGFGAFYDRNTRTLEIVAAHGLSEEYIGALSQRINEKSLAKYVVGTREGLLIDDIQKDPRSAADIATRERLKSTIVVPLQFEHRLLGALSVFCRKPARYTVADFDLVTAAASQIAMSTYQAELYATERRQAGSLAALYRLSHELSKRLTPQEVAEHALPIIQEEIACKRMWFGILNEQGSHIIGRAGFGPGVRRNIIDFQIDLSQRHEYLDDALRRKRAVVVPSGQNLQCPGVGRLLERLGVGTFVIVPLVALGQAVGVLIAEPAVPSSFFAQKRLPLLTSMAGEIATVLVARRFEAKIAEAHKMKMAGLLASGIAHNFNNLLQAIMGQASLIEMQAQKDPTLSNSARMIIEATNKGASLIRQLFSFSRPESREPQDISLSKMVAESRELYRSLLGSNIVLEFDLDEDLPPTHIDFGQIQQVITNLLVNAREAIGLNDGVVKVRTRSIELRSGEVHPEVAPGSYVRLEIEDNGVGMDSEEQSRCFEPFFTTKNVDARTGLGFAGSGLGLSSAYSILRQHDGIVTVSSEPSKGSIFSVYLPVAGRRTSETAAVIDEQLEVGLLGFSDTLLFSVRSTLESLGLKAATLSDQEHVKDFIDHYQNDKQLLMFDVDSLGFDMFGLVRSLKTDHPALRIILVTSDFKRWSRMMRPLEHVEILEKPIGVWSIHSVVRKILGKNGVIPLASMVEVQRTPDRAKTEDEKLEKQPLSKDWEKAD